MERPLISFVLLAYNQERFIREAIGGAFSQTYVPLEIILSDDFSSDRTYKIMVEEAGKYTGPHKIVLNRNKTNLGIGGHVNRIMEIAHGELIVVAAGDDFSLPERTEKTYQAYEGTKGKARSIFSNIIVMNEAGKSRGIEFKTPMKREEFLPEILVKKDFLVCGCSHAWSREVFDIFGPLMVPLACEDMVIPFRSALLGGIEYIHEPLVMHRRHENNLWLYSHNKNIEKDIKFEKVWTFEKKAIYRNWLRDIEKMKSLCPEKETEIRYLRNKILERFSSVEDDIFLINGNWQKRIAVLVKKMLKGESLRTIRHKIGVFLIPGVYRKYMSLKNQEIIK